MDKIQTKGQIVLQRKEETHLASFACVKGSFSELESSLSILHQEELAHFNQLKFKKRKFTYLLGRVSARHALSELIGEEALKSLAIGFGVFKFPILKNYRGDQIQLSISHCEDVGMALAFPEAHPLAIDLEKIDHEKTSAMQSMVNDSEMDLLQAFELNEAEKSTLLWTIKESVSKIIRTGLSMDLKMVAVTSIEKKGIYFESKIQNFGQFKVLSFIGKTYVCSISMPKHSAPRMEDFSKKIVSFLE